MGNSNKSTYGKQNISEWHKDIVKAVQALPAPSADNAGFRRFRTTDNIEFISDGLAWSSVGNMVVLNQICRVLDDTTSRATGYTNSAVQVSGVTDLRAATSTLPSPLRAVWYSMFLITAAPANVRMVVENPDFAAGATTLQGSTVLVGATTAYSGGGVVSLNSLGQLRYVYGGSANVTRTIIDVWAYML